MRGMLILALLACGACEDRRSFDEQYNETASRIGEEANMLDAELNSSTVPEGRSPDPQREENGVNR